MTENNTNLYLENREAHLEARFCPKKKKRKKSIFKRLRYDRIFILLITLALIISSIYFVVDFCKYPETYSSTMANSLRIDLENGDEEAINAYKEKYIARNEYLFDGPMTIEFMAEKYGLDSKVLYEIYTSSEYESAQEFYEDYVQYAAKCQEFIDKNCQ